MRHDLPVAVRRVSRVASLVSLASLASLVSLASCTAGCSILEKKLGKDAGAASADDGGAPTTKAASAAGQSNDGAHVVEGVGAVVAWAPDKGSAAKCTPTPA